MDRYFKLNLERSIEYDETKKKLALESNFEYIILRFSDSFDENKNKLIETINKIKRNENKKN